MSVRLRIADIVYARAERRKKFYAQTDDTGALFCSGYVFGCAAAD